MLTVPSLRRCVRISSTRNASRSSSAVGLGRPTLGPRKKRSAGDSPISEWSARLYSISIHAWVA
jgi:hypothetical protein